MSDQTPTRPWLRRNCDICRGWDRREYLCDPVAHAEHDAKKAMQRIRRNLRRANRE